MRPLEDKPGVQTSECPVPEVLESVAAGDSGSAPEWVAGHVSRCRACAEYLESARFGRRFGAVMSTGGAPSASPGHEAIPAVPGYVIVRELARGGQGIVYQAEQSATGQRVAIKVLHEASSSAGGSRAARARFQREIQIAGTLAHPGIVRPVDSLCLADGRDALILELVEGEPLGSWAKRAADSGAVLRVLAQVADALEHAHQRGVIHRDLKPSNVLVDPSGRARVLDFGVARRRSAGGDIASDRVTMTGEFTGTLAYAAPEQVSQTYAGPDVRSDVYALGVMGYEALTGKLPYAVNGSLETVIRNIVSAEIPGPAEAEIDRDAWTVIAKAMSKEPARRYQSAGELARELRRAAEGEAIEARRDSRWYVIRKGVRRHRLVFSVAMAGLVGLVGVAVALAIGNARLSAALHESTLRQLHAHIMADERARAEAVLWPMIERAGVGRKSDAGRLLWEGTLAQREALWAFAEMQSRAECVRVLRTGVDGPAVVRALSDGRFGVVLANGRSGVYDLGEFEGGAPMPEGAVMGWCSPDGRWIVAQHRDSTAVYDADTGELTATRVIDEGRGLFVSMTVQAWGLAISYEGGPIDVLSLPYLNTLAAEEGIRSGQSVWLGESVGTMAWLQDHATIVLRDLENPDAARTLQIDDSGEAWGHSPVHVLVNEARGECMVLTHVGVFVRSMLDEGATAVRLPWPAVRISGLLDQTGRFFGAREYGDPNARIWRTGTWEQLAVLPGHAIAASDLAFSRDGERILTSDRAGVLREWSTPGFGWQRSIGAPTSRGLDIAVVAAGARVIAADASGRVIAHAINEGRGRVLVGDAGFTVAKVSASERAGLLAVLGDGPGVEVRDLESGEKLWEWVGDGTWSASARFSPSGESIAVCTRSGGVCIFDSRSGREVARSAVGSGTMASSLRWSPDGRLIAVASRDGQVSFLDPDSLGTLCVVRAFESQARGVEWDTSAAALWAAGDEGEIVRIDPRTGEVSRSPLLSEHSLFAIAAHPAGRMLLVGDRAGMVHAVDTRSMSKLASIEAGGAVLALEFEPSGDAVLVSAMDRPITRWDLSGLGLTLSGVRPEPNAYGK